MTAGQGGPPPPPWPGYGPAPSAPVPAYEGPTFQERPLPVRAGLGGFVGAIVLSVISTAVTFLNWDTISAPIIAKLDVPAGTDPDAVRAAAETGVRIGLVASLVFAAVYGLFVLFAWRGRNWARVVLWVIGGFGLLFGLIGLTAGTSPVPFLTGLSFFQLLLLLAGVVFLGQRSSNEWFRYQAWLRATGQAR